MIAKLNKTYNGGIGGAGGDIGGAGTTGADPGSGQGLADTNPEAAAAIEGFVRGNIHKVMPPPINWVMKAALDASALGVGSDMGGFGGTGPGDQGPEGPDGGASLQGIGRDATQTGAPTGRGGGTEGPGGGNVGSVGGSSGEGPPGAAGGGVR